jgi:hypothetical protein
MRTSSWKVYTATMASGADSCSVNIPNEYEQLTIIFPSMSTAAEKSVYVSCDGSTYYPAYFPANSGVVFPAQVLVGSAVTGMAVNVPVYAPYIKVVASAVVSGGGVYKFIV